LNKKTALFLNVFSLQFFIVSILKIILKKYLYHFSQQIILEKSKLSFTIILELNPEIFCFVHWSAINKSQINRQIAKGLDKYWTAISVPQTSPPLKYILTGMSAGPVGA